MPVIYAHRPIIYAPGNARSYRKTSMKTASTPHKRFEREETIDLPMIAMPDTAMAEYR